LIADDLMSARVARTPFFVFPFPTAHNYILTEMGNALRSDCPRPLVILLTRRPRDFASSLESAFQPATITFSKYRIPDGTEFSQFKQFVFNFLKQYPRAHIGVLSSKGKDLCGYFIVRWLLEERPITIPEAIALFNSAVPSGLTKPKYLTSITEIYSDETAFPDPQYGFAYPSYPSFPYADSDAASAPPAKTVEVHSDESLLKSVFPCEPWSDEDDSRFDPPGVAVVPKTSEKVVQELQLLLDLSAPSGFVAPYLSFTERTVSRMKAERNRLYIAMPIPAGRRCLLYARGSDRYLIGEGGFVRQVELYLPETDERPYTHTSAILEGVLARRADGRCVFFMYDFLRHEGEDWRRKPFDQRLSALFTRVLRFRRR
jgi:hypothetical protein